MYSSPSITELSGDGSSVSIPKARVESMEDFVPDVISFSEAISETEGVDRALLIGNGFSAEYFSYANLLASSGLEPQTPLRNLFDELTTVDFEAAISALEGAALVERAYGNAERSAHLVADAQRVREALVHAVNATHPAHRGDLVLQYEAAASFLSNFASVFSLNYDLLLYWVNLERTHLRDGFGLGERSEDGRFHGPFREDAHCSIYNLHGGLHLFANPQGEIFKALDAGDGVVSTVTREIVTQGRLPIYVAEGSSIQKIRKINSIAYLRHCYQVFLVNQAPIFVYGHSAAENDAHIYRAIFTSGAPKLYFGVFEPTDEKVNILDGKLANFQRAVGSSQPYSFFDSRSASVWG